MIYQTRLYQTRLVYYYYSTDIDITDDHESDFSLNQESNEERISRSTCLTDTPSQIISPTNDPNLVVIPKPPQVLPHGQPPDFKATEDGRGHTHTSYIPINTFDGATRGLLKQKNVTIEDDEEDHLIAPIDHPAENLAEKTFKLVKKKTQKRLPKKLRWILEDVASAVKEIGCIVYYRMCLDQSI